ncbi:MAG: hypothetical protein IIC81_05795, partial [Chloroflexi bacterium]|nr:hypothetical protein [Chloroflexota bacterium]
MTQNTLDVGQQLNAALTSLLDELKQHASFARLGDSVGKLPSTMGLPKPDVTFQYGASPDPKEIGFLENIWTDLRESFPNHCARYAVTGMITSIEVFLRKTYLLA